MGLPKRDEFKKEHNDIANIAKALSSPSRVAILEYILQKKQSTCGELVERLPLAQATISRHLKELRQIGLIDGKPQGTSVLYTINRKNWLDFEKKLEKFLSKIRKSKR